MKIKNWEDFQHYKDRRPPWIKLYRELLDDKNWFSLSGDDAKTLVMLWIIAAEDKNMVGELPSVEDLAFRLRKSLEETKSTILRLNHWLEHDASDLLADGLQVAIPETETETETNKEAEAETDNKNKQKGTTEAVQAVFDHYFKVFKKTKAYLLTDKRVKLIQKALKRGHDVETLKQAIVGMSRDTWPGRSTANDLKYAIGESNDEDKVSKWAMYEPEKPITGGHRAGVPQEGQNYDGMPKKLN